MKFKLGFLNSKVARRFFFIFLLCAVIPMTILAVLSFHQVSNQLKVQSQERLHRSCKALGSAIYERLLIIEAELELMKENLDINDFSDPELNYDLNRLSEKFNGIYLLNKDQVYTLYGSDGESLKFISNVTGALKEEKPILFSHPVNGKTHIYMGIVVENKIYSESVLISDINPLYLWFLSYEDVLPPETEFCVLDDDDSFLYATQEKLTNFPKSSTFRRENPALGQFLWGNQDEDYLASYRDLFLLGRFSSPTWTIVLSEPKSHVYAPMVFFKRTFPFLILFSFWVVLLLSFIQIRKSLVPLEKIKDSAKKITDKDFSTRVLINSKDEFQDVADTFNAMAKQLGRLFESIKASSEIQRAILSSLKVDDIVERLLEGMAHIQSSDSSAVILFNFESEKEAKTFIYNNHSLKKGKMHGEKILPEEMRNLQENEDLYFVEYKAESIPEYLSPLVSEGTNYIHLYPILLKGNVKGMITLGYTAQPDLNKDEISQLKLFSELMGVALSNADLLKELDGFNLGTLKSLARAIDAKSSWTAGHSEKGTEIALKIGKILNLSEVELDILHRGGLLHDIGKLGISNDILDKRDSLSAEEFKIMRTHPELGARILEPIAAYTDIILIVIQHHENYDGSGYPHGLEKDNISFYSRIFSVADSFESLTSDRPYRRARDFHTAVEIIKNQAGKQFDPFVVDAFLKSLSREEFKR